MRWGMNFSDPLLKSKEDYADIIEKIKAESSVGIDAQFTHAIIINYLQQLTQRIEKIEEALIKPKLKD
jgi:hypothetical protein